MLTKEPFQFLADLEKNNHRDWFEAHKADFVEAQTEVKSFMNEVLTEMQKSDVIQEQKLYRIYRDVRFSKDKTPYKTHFSGYYRREGESRRGSYFFWIGKDEAHIGGGFYGPNKDDLLRIRKEFELEIDSIEKIVQDNTFKKYFGEMEGEGVATAPRGFDKEHPNLKWIRKKQFFAFRKFSKKEVLSPDFVKEVNLTFKALRPFFDYMSDILTTDLNGISILGKDASSQAS